jgi:hypothetical protein
MAKNCHTCRHLEWHTGESDDESGFTCTGRDLTYEAERTLLQQLESPEYRNRYKRCFEPKEATHG